MADRKAAGGTPKAASAKVRAPLPRKTNVLPVKAEAVPAPKAAAQTKVAVKKAAKPLTPPVTIEAEKAALPPVPPLANPAVAAIVPPPAAAIVEAATGEARAAVEEVLKTIQEGTETMDTTTVEAGKAATDQAQVLFGDFNERTKSAMEKNAKIVQEVTDLAKGNVEALVASSRAAAKGFEALSREAAEYGRKSFEDVSGALKSFSEVRSPADLFRLQSDYARSYFDSVVAESSKISEQVIKLAGEVAEPITNRASVAAERVRALAI